MDHILRCHEIVKTDFVHGENCFLYDSSGKKYIDLDSGIWCTVIGHQNPRIKQVIKSQSDKLIHLGTRFPAFIAEEAAIDVLAITSIENGKCVFLSSGSEAVEFSVQAARKVTGKKFCLTFSNSYLAAYGSGGIKRADEWFLVDWTNFEAEKIDEVIDKIPFEEIGAFVFEPGGSGLCFVKFPPKLLVQRIAEKVKQNGGLLVANEITAGMGRTGKWFGFQHYGVIPDIVALGKGLGNGYPVSCSAMSLRVAETLEAKDFRYAQSHQNDPLGCHVAKEVIATLREYKLIERGEKMGDYFLDGLRRLQEKSTLVKEARGRGMLLGLEMKENSTISVQDLFNKLMEKGILVNYYTAGNMIRFSPALTIKKESISYTLECLDNILN